MWRCNRKYGQGERCCIPTITEEDIKKLFVQAFNKLMSERTSAITDCEWLATELEDTSGLDQEIEATQKEIDTAVEQNRRLIREQAVTGMPTEEFDARAAMLNEKITSPGARASADSCPPLTHSLKTSKIGMNRHGTFWSHG